MTSPPPGLRPFALVDTSAYYALTDPQDKNHRSAQTITDRLRRERWRLFTTNFILAEVHALLLSRLNRRVALEVLLRLDRSPTTVTRISRADELRARQIIARYRDKDFSLTDATSFVVMARLGLPWAFTSDSNFAQYGLPVLTAELI